MAGTKRYVTDGYDASGAPQDVTQAMFVMIWLAFKWAETNGICTEIARNNGSASTYANPLGTDFYDGANPFGEGAWAIFEFPANAGRANPFTVRFAWSYGTSSFDNAPNTPSVCHGSPTGNPIIGFQMAFAFNSNGASVDPWPAAASGSMGSDTLQDPIWATPVGGQLYVFPRSNMPGGTHDTSKNNHAGLISGTVPLNGRVNCWFDNDSFAVEMALNENARLSGSVYAGHYEPMPGATFEIPFFMIATDDSTIVNSNVAVGTTFGSGSKQGGICLNKDGLVHELRMQYDDDLLNASSPTPFQDGLPMHLMPQVMLCKGVTGQVGWMDPTMYRLTRNRTHGDLSQGGSLRVTSGSVDTNRAKLVTSWDMSVPGSSFTRTGNQS